jgi:hypothetical protein
MIKENLRNDRQWRSAIGLSEAQFDNLLPHFELAYDGHFGKTMSAKVADSPNVPYIQSYEDLLLLTLFYLKTGVTYDVLGVVFGMDGSNAKRNIEKGIVVAQRALSDLGLLPKRGFSTIKEFEEHMKGNEKLLIDATEMRIERPSDQDEQKDNYSGKKNVIR